MLEQYQLHPQPLILGLSMHEAYLVNHIFHSRLEFLKYMLVEYVHIFYKYIPDIWVIVEFY